MKLVTFSSTVAIDDEMLPFVAASLTPQLELRYTPNKTTVDDVPRNWPISALDAAIGIVVEQEESIRVSADAIRRVEIFFIVVLF